MEKLKKSIEIGLVFEDTENNRRKKRRSDFDFRWRQTEWRFNAMGQPTKKKNNKNSSRARFYQRIVHLLVYYLVLRSLHTSRWLSRKCCGQTNIQINLYILFYFSG